MSRLDEIRGKDTPDLEGRGHDERAWWDGYKEGFDAAIALELPVKFSDWLDSPQYKKWLSFTSFKDEDIVVRLAFQYWIDNVYDFIK